MNFIFELRSDVHTRIIDADLNSIQRGEVTGHDMHDAIKRVIGALRPDLVEDDCPQLAPVITIERNQNGSFTVDIETHGLCNATLDIEQTS